MKKGKYSLYMLESYYTSPVDVNGTFSSGETVMMLYLDNRKKRVLEERGFGSPLSTKHRSIASFKRQLKYEVKRFKNIADINFNLTKVGVL